MSDNEIRDAIAEAIGDNDVILFMKGSPEAPACGFSARTVAMLEALETPFAAVDVLPDPRIRQELSALSSWPTIPQLFVKGELVGGCDIVTEMYESGELAESLGVAAPDAARGGAGRRRAAARADGHREPPASSARTGAGASPAPADRRYRLTSAHARVAADPQVRVAVGLDLAAADRGRDAVVAREGLELVADLLDGLAAPASSSGSPPRR